MKFKNLDKLVLNKVGFNFHIRMVHVCPDCGWEVDDLESSSRCQACWASGDRVTMGDLEEVYDLHPSTNVGDAIKVAETFFAYSIEKLANSYGYEVTLWDEFSLSVTVSEKSIPMAVCTAVGSFELRQ